MLTLSRLYEWSRQVGFDDCSIASVRRLDEDAEFLSRWLAAGFHGSMQYMEQNIEKRVNPQALVPDCKTVIVCILSYYKQVSRPADAPQISLSGLSENDYHLVMKDKLLALEHLIGEQHFLSSHQHLFCDSAPILERRWAEEAHLGWIGKNKQFIHPKLGSFVHIGILLCQSEIAEDMPREYSETRCAECDRCVRACPTGALRGEMFDARKCISYLTIERKEPLDKRYEKLLQKVAYGCDACAMACPYNKGLTPLNHSELRANPAFEHLTLSDWQHLSRRQKLKLVHRLAKE